VEGEHRANRVFHTQYRVVCSLAALAKQGFVRVSSFSTPFPELNMPCCQEGLVVHCSISIIPQWPVASGGRPRCDSDLNLVGYI
jgi:hypothetical protein